MHWNNSAWVKNSRNQNHEQHTIFNICCICYLDGLNHWFFFGAFWIWTWICHIITSSTVTTRAIRKNTVTLRWTHQLTFSNLKTVSVVFSLTIALGKKSDGIAIWTPRYRMHLNWKLWSEYKWMQLIPGNGHTFNEMEFNKLKTILFVLFFFYNSNLFRDKTHILTYPILYSVWFKHKICTIFSCTT